MTDERIKSEDEKAAQLRQWFNEAARHPLWKRYVREIKKETKS